MAATPTQGYVLHSFGSERYLHHAVASVTTLRRYDTERPVALYCPRHHRTLLEEHGLDRLFQYIGPLPAKNRSIVGFKHHLHSFMPFERSLYIDTDVVWCRDPDPLWKKLAAYRFTATGLERADFFFGGPKGPRVALDVLLNRRRRTLRRFGLTHLPRVQAGMIYSSNRGLAQQVCETSQRYLDRRDETHFRSRLNDDGRSEESCEWSMAMAMSRLELPILPWMQGYQSPQLDFIKGMTEYDDDFEHVTCQYYSHRLTYSLRSLWPARLRNAVLKGLEYLPGLGDRKDVTPFVLHFGWLRYKKLFHRFAERTWTRLTRRKQPTPAHLPLSTNGNGNKQPALQEYGQTA